MTGPRREGVKHGWMDGEGKTHLLLFDASVFCAALVAIVLLTSFVCSLGLAPEWQREGTDSMKTIKIKARLDNHERTHSLGGGG